MGGAGLVGGRPVPQKCACRFIVKTSLRASLWLMVCV